MPLYYHWILLYTCSMINFVKSRVHRANFTMNFINWVVMYYAIVQSNTYHHRQVCSINFITAYYIVCSWICFLLRSFFYASLLTFSVLFFLYVLREIAWLLYNAKLCSYLNLVKWFSIALIQSLLYILPQNCWCKKLYASIWSMAALGPPLPHTFSMIITNI